jgi:serine protease Do
MPRPPAFVLWLATLAAGMALGLSLGRLGTPLVAQTAPVAAASDTELARKGDEDALYRDLARGYEKFQGIDRTFEAVARVVSPSVVHITARKVGPRDDGDFGRFEESGSGVIVRPDGGKGLFVLTNNHVVAGATAADVSIRLQDGQVLHPELFWADPKVDVAVLKLTRADLPAARLGNSEDARVGTWVMALGSPFGLTHSVSHGIISARGRHEEELEIDGVDHQEFLQTDAAINPGNSGGPLVNMKGEVIGLNTAIASNGGGSEGVGFSIPINLAKWAMIQLVSGGKVYRGAMGVNLQAVSPQKAVELGLERPRGARIVAVHEDSPASRAKLTIGDVILRFNGVDVNDDMHLINLVSVSPIGRPQDVVVWRDGKSTSLRVTIADRDAILAKSTLNGAPRRTVPTRRAPGVVADDLGLTFKPMDEATRSRLFGAGATVPKGVLIATVDVRSPLAKSLKDGDYVLSVNSKVIATAEDAIRALRRSAGALSLVVVVRRVVDGTAQDALIRVP